MRLFRPLLPCVLLSLALFGCAAIPLTDNAKARNVMDGLAQFYMTDALITTGAVQTRAHIYRPDPMTTRVELLSPDNVAGFVYSFKEGGVELSYQGLSFNVDSFGGTRTIPMLRGVSALSFLLLPEAGRELPQRQDGFWVLRSEFAGEPVLLFLDEESAIPAKLLLQGSQVEFIFENFTFLG